MAGTGLKHVLFDHGQTGSTGASACIGWVLEVTRNVSQAGREDAAWVV